jgi:hypothetical protein
VLCTWRDARNGKAVGKFAPRGTRDFTILRSEMISPSSSDDDKFPFPEQVNLLEAPYRNKGLQNARGRGKLEYRFTTTTESRTTI